jgi:uncharacterized protein (DUF58 family)
MPPAAASAGVYVDLAHLIAFEAKGRKVSLSPRQPVNSLLSGRFASRLRARGLNFEEIRDYRAGDDVRSIDWKVTARLLKPHVRAFNEERDRQGLLIVDQRLSMFFGSRWAMKSVAAAETAALMARRILAAGDRTAASSSMIATVRRYGQGAAAARCCGSCIVSPRRMPPSASGAASQVRRPCYRALEQARRIAAHDTTVIVLSDFDGADAATRQAIASMAPHNDVVALAVHDPLQSELPVSGQMTVTDARPHRALLPSGARWR